MNKKYEHRVFTLADFEKEEVYLRDHHKNGWKFMKFYYPGIYVFEKCVPEDVIYQLDFNQDSNKNKLEYIQMFKDFGWDYLCDVNSWSYFRKPAAEASENESIFSDIDSKIDMMHRVVKSKMIPLFILFVLIIVPQMVLQYDYFVSDQSPSFLRMILFFFYLTLFVVYVTMFTNFATKLYRLKNKTLNK